MMYLLNHFNINLVDDNGCLVCLPNSDKRKDSIPDKTQKLESQQTITDEFDKLSKHCTDNHTMMLDFNHGLGLLHFPTELSRKIVVTYNKVCSGLSTISEMVG